MFTHSTLIPFSVTSIIDSAIQVRPNGPRLVQTLPRRPYAAAFWLLVMGLGGLMVNEAHSFYPDFAPSSLRYGQGWFYMGWILVWVSPVIAWLTYLGGKLRKNEWKAWAVGSFYLCMVDT